MQHGYYWTVTKYQDTGDKSLWKIRFWNGKGWFELEPRDDKIAVVVNIDSVIICVTDKIMPV